MGNPDQIVCFCFLEIWDFLQSFYILWTWCKFHWASAMMTRYLTGKFPSGLLQAYNWPFNPWIISELWYNFDDAGFLQELTFCLPYVNPWIVLMPYRMNSDFFFRYSIDCCSLYTLPPLKHAHKSGGDMKVKKLSKSILN